MPAISKSFYVFFSFFLVANLSAKEITMVTYIAPESDVDYRGIYDFDVLKLALDKTRGKYGDYELKPAPSMPWPRIRVSLLENRFKNLVAMDSYDDRRENEKLTYIDFPIHLDVASYRVCFVHSPDLLSGIKSKEEYKKYRYGYGKGWLDSDIFNYNGYKVIESISYEPLFKMVSYGKVDAFCRGINEVSQEYQARKNEGLNIDGSMLFYYPLPRFFYVNKASGVLANRIKEGLVMSWNDKSLQLLFKKTFYDGISKLNIRERRVVELENPYIRNIKKDSLCYKFNPVDGSFLGCK